MVKQKGCSAAYVPAEGEPIRFYQVFSCSLAEDAAQAIGFVETYAPTDWPMEVRFPEKDEKPGEIHLETGQTPEVVNFEAILIAYGEYVGRTSFATRLYAFGPDLPEYRARANAHVLAWIEGRRKADLLDRLERDLREATRDARRTLMALASAGPKLEPEAVA